MSLRIGDRGRTRIPAALWFGAAVACAGVCGCVAPPPTGELATEPYVVPVERVREETSLSTAVQVPSSEERDLVYLFEDTGVRFARMTRKERFGRFECGGISETASLPWVERAANELGRHSPKLVRASGLRWVVLCAGLRAGGRARYGAISADGLLLEAGRPETAIFFRSALHHELFHLLDLVDGGIADAEWERLNAPGARYGRGGATALEAANSFGTGEPGFVSEYGQSAVEEDKADIFCFLASNPVGLRKLAARDPWVGRKRELMLRRLAPLCSGHEQRVICEEARY